MAWDLSGAAYASDLAAIGTWGVSFKPDGTRMYIANRGPTFNQYDLGSPWLLFTYTTGSSFNSSAQVTTLNDVQFDTTGTKMYLLDQDHGGTIFQYTLSTAWDISTASYSGKSGVVGGTAVGPQHIDFKPDGTIVYVTASSTTYQFSLSTAWDISTISYSGKSHAWAEDTIQAQDMFIKPDGTMAWMTGSGHSGNPGLWQYTLGTAWDISTISYTGTSLNIGPQETTPRAVFIKPDGTYLYMGGTATNRIYRYVLGGSGGGGSASGWVVNTIPFG